MNKGQDPFESNIFSASAPLSGTYFSAERTTASGLYRNLSALEQWTYENFPNGNYAIALWERVGIAGTGDLAGTAEEILQRLRAGIDARGLNLDFRKGAFGCVARSGAGQYYQMYCFDDQASAEGFAREMGGAWIIAVMVAWVSMY